MSLWRYASYLPAIAEEHRLSLGEGGTPLVRSRRIGPRAGLDNLYFKLESCNPTGSFKDRFAVMAAAEMSARGLGLCLATSSGNTGSALAAACALAGISCYVAVVDGAPQNKIRNMQVYGASIYTVPGFGRDPAVTASVMERLRGLCAAGRGSLQISAYKHAPVGMAGCETIAYELHEQAPGPIQHVFTQAGGGGMTLAVARGFQRLHRNGLLDMLPRVHCVQPLGNDTIATPLRDGLPAAREVRCTSRISGLQVPNVLDGDDVIAACRALGGQGHAVTDEAVFLAQKRLALEEGIFTEPAGATALAGVLDAAVRGEVARDEIAICTITGIGFKDDSSMAALVAGADCPKLECVEAIDEFVGRTR